MKIDQSLKQCCVCKKHKDRSQFHREKRRKDGLSPRCKECVKEYQQANHEKMVQAAYRWRDANPDKAKQSIKRWKKRNPDKVRKYNCNNDWKKKNPQRNVANVQRRNARIKGNGGSYTAEEWEALCKRFGYHCLCCGQKKKLTVDHIVPISKGGMNTIDNIQPLCLQCNSRKYQKTIDYRPKS